MFQKGYVSLWLGNFESKKQFQDYFFTSYTEDGDVSPSNFQKDFHIEDIDEDFMETVYFEQETTRLFTLLDGCSYDEIIIPNFIELQGDWLNDTVNSLILLYDFRYDSKGIFHSLPIQYLGSVQYKSSS